MGFWINKKYVKRTPRNFKVAHMDINIENSIKKIAESIVNGGTTGGNGIYGGSGNLTESVNVLMQSDDSTPLSFSDLTRGLEIIIDENGQEPLNDAIIYSACLRFFDENANLEAFIGIDQESGGFSINTDQFFAIRSNKINNAISISSATGGIYISGTLLIIGASNEIILDSTDLDMHISGNLFINTIAAATGSFTAQSGETITVTKGIITAITP